MDTRPASDNLLSDFWRAAGCETVDLSALRPGDAARKARALNAAAERGAAQAGRAARVSARSIAALVADYRQSLGFRAKRASTQRAYGADLKAIEAKWGPHPVAAFDKPLVARWYEALHAANGPGTLIWNAATGQPYTDKAFWSHWAQVRDLAAKTVPDCATIQWRDLRRTFANMSRAGGASVWDAGDALGNTAAANPRLRATYMAPQIDTTLRAVQAVRRPKPQAKG